MPSDDLPSDEEFLEGLMRSSVSPHVSGMREWFVKQAHDAINEQIEKGIIDQSDRDTYLEIQLAAIDPDRNFQGNQIKSLRASALDYLKADREPFENVPVGAFAVVEMNAFAICTPRGGAAVALNASLWLFLKVINYCAFAIIYRKSAAAIGTHHSNETYARNIISVVDAIRQAAILIMTTDGEHSIADCVGPAARPDKFIAATMNLQLEFILLHEYGHIFHGHLDADLTRKIPIKGADLNVYLTSHRQEFEADEFAIRRLFLSIKSEDVRHHCVTTLTVLFLLFDMCEKPNDTRLLGTHPASRDRLQKIYETCKAICGEEVWSRVRETSLGVERLFESLKKYRADLGLS